MNVNTRTIIKYLVKFMNIAHCCHNCRIETELGGAGCAESCGAIQAQDQERAGHEQLQRWVHHHDTCRLTRRCATRWRKNIQGNMLYLNCFFSFQELFDIARFFAGFNKSECCFAEHVFRALVIHIVCCCFRATPTWRPLCSSVTTNWRTISSSLTQRIGLKIDMCA